MTCGIWGWAPSRRCGFADRFAASSEKDCPSAQAAKYQPKTTEHTTQNSVSVIFHGRNAVYLCKNRFLIASYASYM